MTVNVAFVISERESGLSSSSFACHPAIMLIISKHVKYTQQYSWVEVILCSFICLMMMLKIMQGLNHCNGYTDEGKQLNVKKLTKIT